MLKTNKSIYLSFFVLFSVIFSSCSSNDGGAIDSGTDRLPDTGDTQVEELCPSLSPYCSRDGKQVLSCDPATGSVTKISECSGGQFCVDGSCRDVLCTPLSTQCMNEEVALVCRSDGSGWDPIECGEYRKCNSETGKCEIPCKLRLFVLLDRSGSMSESTPPKWDQAREAMRQVISSTASSEIEFGLGAFPTDGNCGVSGFVVYPVPMTSVDLIDEFFTSNSPNGNTPLLDVMKAMLVDTSANLNDPAYYNFILVISDGADTCYGDCLTRCGPFDIQCITDCENMVSQQLQIELADTTTALLEQLSIRTFVIGFGSDVAPEQLDAIAKHGGTVLNKWLNANNVTELNEALQQIIDEMRECIPPVQ